MFFFFWEVQQSYATESSLQGCHAVSLSKWLLTIRKNVLNQRLLYLLKELKFRGITFSGLMKTMKNVWNDSESPGREFVWTSWIQSRIVNYAKPTLVVEGVGMSTGNDVTVTWLCLNTWNLFTSRNASLVNKKRRLCASNLKIICYGNMKLFASRDICSYYVVLSDRLSGFVCMTWRRLVRKKICRLCAPNLNLLFLWSRDSCLYFGVYVTS